MRIGELARRADVTADTIRYYEKEGLLNPPPRTPAGYRDYASSAVEDLSFIRKARTLGLKLSEVREVLALTADGHIACDHVRATVATRLADVESRMAELRALRTTLRRALERFDEVNEPAPGCRCVVIDAQS